MLDRYSTMCSHTSLFIEGDLWHFALHWAQIAVHARLDPDERRISQLIADSDLRTRLEWINQVTQQLQDLLPSAADEQWDRWIRGHWVDRLRGTQKVLADEEATAMANWLPYLDNRFPDAVGLACERKAPLTDNNWLMVVHLFMTVEDVEPRDSARRLQTHPEQVAALTAHMMKSTDRLPGIESSIGFYLAELVVRLQRAVDCELADELAEHSKRLDLQTYA